MATIYQRQDKGLNTWHVQFRRKGIPYVSFCFNTKEEAQRFAEENEWRFIHDPWPFIKQNEEEKLQRRREREFQKCHSPSVDRKQV